MELINSRAKSDDVKVFAMNTYFYQKLSEQGYDKANLKRWTKRMKLDIFSLDKLLIPINIGNAHWTCAVINFADKRFEYYDSMSDSGYRYNVFKVSHLDGSVLTIAPAGVPPGRAQGEEGVRIQFEWLDRCLQPRKFHPALPS